MNSAMITALVRHILTGLAGGMAVRYSIDGAALDAVVSGVSAAAGIAWSLLDKRRSLAAGS